MSPSRMSEPNDMHGTNPDRFRSQQLYNMTREYITTPLKCNRYRLRLEI